MGMKFREIIDSLGIEQLSRIKRDIDTGSVHLKKIVERKLVEKEKEHGKYCNVCMNEIDTFNPNNFTLVFGAEGFKKKSSFCGMDCLKYFLAHLEQMKEKVREQ